MAEDIDPSLPPFVSGKRDDYSKYLVESGAEIVYILRAIAQKTELITAYFNRGADFLPTSILYVDADAVVLDCGPNPEINKKILRADKIMFMTSQDRVKVQFTADRIEEVIFEGRDAFRIPLPAALLKLQRREFYRLTTPIGHPVACTIPLEGGGRLEVALVDISIGGIGITLPETQVKVEPQMVFRSCSFMLPEVGTIVTALEIRSTFNVTLKNGLTARRAGCQFIDLPGNMQSMIQRYIIKIERERRAMQVDRE